MQHVQCLNLPLLVAAPFPVWFVFYYIGVVYALNRQCLIRARYILIGIVLGVCLEFCEMVYLKQFGHMVHGLKVSAQVYSFFAVLFFFSTAARNIYGRISNAFVARAIQYVGKVSFFMYLTHCIYISLLSALLPVDNWLFKWAIISFLSVAVAYLVQVFLPMRLHRYIGL